ncbi:MAG: hypothetical protein QM820_04250 [Minicystis sp.]
MSRTKEARVRRADPHAAGERASAPRHLAPVPRPPEAAPQAASALPGLATGRIESIDGDVVHLVVAGERVAATRDPIVHLAVLTGARDRGERVLCERGADGAWVIIGALKVQPIPGIDVADSYTIEADRVTIRAGSEIALTSAAAGIVLRAVSEVETYAERIISRAEGVHKIVGRMLRLN